MSNVIARGEAKSAQLDVVVIRADGTREDLGTVAYWHRSPIMRLLWRLSQRPRR